MKTPLGFRARSQNEAGSHLERSRVKREAIAVDKHPQGCQGDEKPASKGGKVEELVEFPSDEHQHHQRILETKELWSPSCSSFNTHSWWWGWRWWWVVVVGVIASILPATALQAEVFVCGCGSWKRWGASGPLWPPQTASCSTKGQIHPR